MEAAAVCSGKGLQRLQGIGHKQEIGVSHISGIIGKRTYDKIAHPLAIEVSDIAMTVVTFSNKSKKQSFFGEGERTAVGKQHRNRAIPAGSEIGPHNLGNLGYIIFHQSLMLRAAAGRQSTLRLHQRKHIFCGNFRV